MYKIKLKRVYLGKTYTIGHIYLPGESNYFCDTLEDPVRDKKIKGKTAIPYGCYKITFTYSSMSPKYDNKLMPLLNNVPNFSGIRIHAGNTAEDTEGCILVGENKVKGKVLNSRSTFWKLYDILWANKEDLWIDII